LKAKKKLRTDAESAVTDLEQAAASAAKKLKSLTAEHDKERAALLKRAENAEGRLKPVTEELLGHKRHIYQMTHAIFGKLPFPFNR
jgi:hypothetical protein